MSKAIKCIGDLFGRGRKWKITAAIDRLIRRKVKSNRRISTHSVKAKIESELGISLHANIIRNCVHEARLFCRLARKTPLMYKANRGKRLKHAKEMLKKLMEF